MTVQIPDDEKNYRNKPISMVRKHHADGAFDSLHPREVIRGESFSTPLNITPFPFVQPTLPRKETPGDSAITDWLNCTFLLKDGTLVIHHFISGLVQIIGKAFLPFYYSDKGLNGWHRSFKLGHSGGRFAIGGQNDTAFLSLSGHACSLISRDCWPALVDYLDGQYNAKITRWDGAVDDYDGVHSVDSAMELYKSGSFATGGNKPLMKQHGNFEEPDGTGRTMEIGKRKNGKLLRIYEKGMHLGDAKSPWTRWELELHNRDRVIPWDALINPGQYVAGAYKCMSWISGKASKIKTFKKATEIGYDKLSHCLRMSYGKHINVMLAKEGSPEKVVEKLIREGIPKRLQIPVPPEINEVE